MKTIGVLGLQGDVAEHIGMVRQLGGEAVWLKKASQLGNIDALIIPGGESTTIGGLLADNGMFREIVQLGRGGLPIFGTCAGAILLAKKGDAQVRRTGQQLLGLMDMKVDRNAFGRQRDSFETPLKIRGIPGKGPFNGVFIRAPVIEEVYGNCMAISEYGRKIVAARQANFLACCFHPELTDDPRVHRFFLGMIE
ncbi:MAG: pyridoxal 5'-phosphate synthase glutaminase subunit PdxT [Candidatus Micrarchaeota archaeon]